MSATRHGELQCYFCGYLAAHITYDPTGESQPTYLTPAEIGPGIRAYQGKMPRCGRCGGPLFVNELLGIRTREPEQLCGLDDLPRRGRPRGSGRGHAASRAEESRSTVSE